MFTMEYILSAQGSRNCELRVYVYIFKLHFFFFFTKDEKGNIKEQLHFFYLVITRKDLDIAKWLSRYNEKSIVIATKGLLLGNELVFTRKDVVFTR